MRCQMKNGDRKAFEAWWQESEGYGLRCERAMSIDEAAWMAWQARTNPLSINIIRAVFAYGVFIGVISSAVMWVIVQ